MVKYAFLIVVACSVLAATPVQEKEFAEAYAKAIKQSADKSATVRAASVKELAAYAYDKADPKMADLVMAVLVNELNQKNEQDISGDVLSACVEALQKITNEKTILQIVKKVELNSIPWRVKFYLIHALTNLPGDKVTDALKKLANDKTLQVQVAAVDALGKRGDKNVLPLLVDILQKSFIWEVRLSALEAIKGMGDESLAETLVEVMRKARPDEGRLVNQIRETLKQWVSGADGGHSADAWANILAAKKKGAQADNATTVEITPVNFFGLKTKSTKVIFVVDISGSMNEPASEPPAREDKEPQDIGTGKEDSKKPENSPAREKARNIKGAYDGRQVKVRIDALKKELINSIYYLDPKVHFNIIAYSTGVARWQDCLMPATWEAKLEAITFVDKISAAGATNIFDALEMSFMFVQQKGKPEFVVYDRYANYATGLAGVDTIYLLTDGVPNAGRIPSQSGIVSELLKVNKLRKIIINTIAIGDPNPNSPAGAVEPAFLQRIATDNNGSFVHIHK